MTWGYWGIVSGLLILLGIFFVAMEILYARAKNGATGRQAENAESDKAGKHAA
jgi:hypothetical protein